MKIIVPVFLLFIFSWCVLAQETVSVKMIFPFSRNTQVEQFEKVELGVGLPIEISNKVFAFVNKKNSNLASNELINPFNPEQLDVQLLFWQKNGEEKINFQQRFGFYYESYTPYNERLNKVGSDYNIRARFTPEKTGEWFYKAILIIDNDTLRSSTLKFNCVNSNVNNKGFLKIAENKQYFKLGDSSFFPVGQNIPWPGSIWYNSKETLPHKDYINYQKLITQLKQNGGNYFRMLLTPWTYDIEFEALGDYSKRMGNAWELDQLVETAEKEGLKIHFNLLLHGVLENPSVYTITNWDWPAYEDSVYTDKTCVDTKDQGFCYKRELNLKNPIEFFTNEEAKKHYKHKLRYLIARWGYSTSIGVLELLSEINNAGQQGNLKNTGNGCPSLGTVIMPYADLDSVPRIVLAWQNEMAKFIKLELKHNRHPVAVSYTGDPDIKGGDLSYYSPYIDLPTYNAYSFDKKQNKYARLTQKLKKYRAEKLQISNSILRKEDSRRSVKLEKPFMLSEIGSGFGNCDNNTIWLQSILLSPFTGLSGVAMPWLNYKDREHLWRYFKFVNQFMKQTDLSKSFWEVKYQTTDSKQVELFALSNKNKITIGAVNNKTFNYFTTKKACKDCFCKNDSVVSYLQELKNIESNSKEHQVQLRNMGFLKRFTIQFYNPLSGENLLAKRMKTNLFGRLVIPYPELIGAERPIVYFKIKPN